MAISNIYTYVIPTLHSIHICSQFIRANGNEQKKFANRSTSDLGKIHGTSDKFLRVTSASAGRQHIAATGDPPGLRILRPGETPQEATPGTRPREDLYVWSHPVHPPPCSECHSRQGNPPDQPTRADQLGPQPAAAPTTQQGGEG